MPTVFGNSCRVPDLEKVARRNAQAELFAALRDLRGESLTTVWQLIVEQPCIGGIAFTGVIHARFLERLEKALAQLAPDDPAREVVEQLHRFYAEATA